MERTKILTDVWFSELSEDEQREYRRALKLPVIKDLVFYSKEKCLAVRDVCVEKNKNDYSILLVKVPLCDEVGEPSTYQWIDESSNSMVVRILDAFFVEMQKSDFLNQYRTDGNASDMRDDSQKQIEIENNFGTMYGRYHSLFAFPTNYVFIDIETNGKEYKGNEEEIIEIGAIRFEDGMEKARFGSLVKPSKPIGKKTIELTGITNEDLDSARHISEVISDFVDFVGDSCVVGFNIQTFDKPRLNKAYCDYLDCEFDNPTVDIKIFTDKFFKKGENVKSASVECISKYFDISTEGEHRAVQDCVIENDIYNHIKQVIIERYGSYKKFYNVVYQRKTINLLPCK